MTQETSLKLQGLSRLPFPVGVHCASHLCFDSLFALLHVDKQTQSIAQEALKHLKKKQFDSASFECASLLTGCWNMALDRMPEARGPLRAVTWVSLSGSSVRLQTAMNTPLNFTSYHPEEESSLDSALKTKCWKTKAAAAKKLVAQIVDPSLKSITLITSRLLYRVPMFIDRCFDSMTIKEDDKIYKIQKVLAFHPNSESSEFLFQLIQITSPSSKDKNGAISQGDLAARINTACKSAWEALPKLQKYARGHEPNLSPPDDLFCSSSDLQALMELTLLRIWLEKRDIPFTGMRVPQMNYEPWSDRIIIFGNTPILPEIMDAFDRHIASMPLPPQQTSYCVLQ